MRQVRANAEQDLIAELEALVATMTETLAAEAAKPGKGRGAQVKSVTKAVVVAPTNTPPVLCGGLSDVIMRMDVCIKILAFTGWRERFM
jgi:hypothetical protein